MKIFPCVVPQLPTLRIGRGEVPLTRLVPILPNTHLSKSRTLIITLLVQVKLCVPYPPASLPFPCSGQDMGKAPHRASSAGQQPLSTAWHPVLNPSSQAWRALKLPYSASCREPSVEPRQERGFLWGKQSPPVPHASTPAFLNTDFLPTRQPAAHLPSHRCRGTSAS